MIPTWITKDCQDGRYGDCEVFKIASECLNRLINVTSRDLYELILVDNGSTLTDGEIKDNEDIKFSPSWYWSQADILIRNSENLGFGPAVSEGVKLANGEYILQMNNDILVWEGWLETMLEDFEHLEKIANPKIGMLMPALVKNNKIRFPEVLDLKKEDIDMPNVGKFGPHAQFGSFWMMRASLAWHLIFEDGFFFDPQFEMLFKEDRDLYERIYAKGFETFRTHNLRVHHTGNLTVSKVENHKEYSAKNRERFEAKWGERDTKVNLS